jgi:hypothetical protein
MAQRDELIEKGYTAGQEAVNRIRKALEAAES